MPEVELYARTNGELLFGPVIPDNTRPVVVLIARLLFALILIEEYCINGAPMINTPDPPAPPGWFWVPPVP